jgi:branched-chain amino acid transport system ATP-binding protein
MSALAVRGLTGGYGPVTVLRDVTFDVEEGSVATILGANGAGKTTTLRALSGMLNGFSGSAGWAGENLIGQRTEQVAKLGVAHVPEGRGTLTELTVEENLRIGAYLRKDRAAIPADLDRCYDYFPRLRERRRQKAGSLSGGEQQMLAISRALMQRPRLMLLDEPSLGLAPVITRTVFEVLRRINADEGTTMLVVEQNAALALDLASHAFVVESGRIVLAGKATDIKADEALRRSYLGY